MRHVVNISLLITFGALAVTGVMAFVLPFSLTTTQIHIAAGLVTVVLIGFHLAARLPYFKKQISFRRSGGMSRGQLASIVLSFGGLLFLAGMAMPPVSWLVNQSYESRNRAQIVRSSHLSGFDEPSPHQKLVARTSNDPKAYELSMRMSFPKTLEVLPSIAVWAETTTGTLIETLYLEQSLAYSDKPVWHGMKTARNHILPIWRHRYTMVSGIKPDGEVDAVSGATETHQFALDPYLVPGEGNKFVICIEINVPSDPNKHWTDEKLGQPSLLYTAYVKLDEEKRYHILELTGHGGGAEDSGNIQYDLESVTTAKELVDLLLVRVAPDLK